MNGYVLVGEKIKGSGPLQQDLKNQELKPLHKLNFIRENELKKHENIKGTLIPREITFNNDKKHKLNRDVVIDVKDENKNLLDLSLRKILTNMSKSVVDTYAEIVVTSNRNIPLEDKCDKITNFLKKEDRLIYIGMSLIVLSFSFVLLL